MMCSQGHKYSSLLPRFMCRLLVGPSVVCSVWFARLTTWAKDQPRKRAPTKSLTFEIYIYKYTRARLALEHAKPRREVRDTTPSLKHHLSSLALSIVTNYLLLVRLLRPSRKRLNESVLYYTLATHFIVVVTGFDRLQLAGAQSLALRAVAGDRSAAVERHCWVVASSGFFLLVVVVVVVKHACVLLVGGVALELSRWRRFVL